MKSFASFLGLAAMFGGFETNEQPKGTNFVSALSSAEKWEKYKRIRHDQHNQRLLNRGCKMFNEGGYMIIALNKKNALRKYNNLIAE